MLLDKGQNKTHDLLPALLCSSSHPCTKQISCVLYGALQSWSVGAALLSQADRQAPVQRVGDAAEITQHTHAFD